MTLLINSFYRMFFKKEDHVFMNTFNFENQMESKVHSFLEKFFFHDLQLTQFDGTCS